MTDVPWSATSSRAYRGLEEDAEIAERLRARVRELSADVETAQRVAREAQSRAAVEVERLLGHLRLIASTTRGKGAALAAQAIHGTLRVPEGKKR